MEKFKIGDHAIGPGEPTFVIAEAGSNHNGKLDTAKELIDVAADAGADAVKFQTFRASDTYVEDSGNVDYLQDERSIYEIVKSMEMPYEWIPKLYDYCEENDILFLSTPFDEQSAEKLANYVPAWKIASYTMTHHPFLRTLAETDKPIIMSTGAHEMSEVRESVSVLKESGCDEIALLQCIAAYPTPLESANVRVIEALRESFSIPSGLSDHTLDPVTAPAAAVALGASIVEKHFTLDKSMEGPDHKFALEPDELNTMVTAIRDAERVLGSSEKQVLDVEKELYDVARRAIHATQDIEVGEQLTQDNVGVLRPGERKKGLEPKFLDEILGRTVTTTVQKGDGIQWSDLEN